MGVPNPQPDAIPTDVRTLADACSIHYRVSSRLWTLAATITLVVVTAKASEGTITFLGFGMDPAHLYPVCAMLLAIINIAYCSAHLQAFHISFMFRDLLNSLDAEKQVFSSNFSVADAAHALSAPALNRIYPLTRFLPERVGGLAYKVVKLPTDILFFAVPVFGCVYALFRASRTWQWCLGILVLVSVFASLILVVQSCRWVFSTPAKMTKRSTDA